MRLFHDADLATATIWAEARGESHKGRVMVGEVIRRRARLKYNSDGSIPGTVARDRQFSCWNHDDAQRVKMLKLDYTSPIVQECAHAWAESELTNYSNGAVLYHAVTINPPEWAKRCTVVAKEGGHIFYVERM